MNIERVLIAIVLAVTGTVGSLGLISSPAAAVPSCSGVPDNYFDGYSHDNSVHTSYNFEGASAYAVVQDGLLCTTDQSASNFTNAWVMVVSRDHLSWSQVGWERTGGQVLRWFSQHHSPGWAERTKYSASSISSQVGVRHTFRELFSYGCDCMKSFIDTTLIDASLFNPFLHWSSGRFDVQYLGESRYVSNDIVGTYGARTAFTALGVQYVSDDQLHPVPCTLFSNRDSTRWGIQSHGCDAFDIWTN